MNREGGERGMDGGREGGLFEWLVVKTASIKRLHFPIIYAFEIRIILSGKNGALCCLQNLKCLKSVKLLLLFSLCSFIIKVLFLVSIKLN